MSLLLWSLVGFISFFVVLLFSRAPQNFLLVYFYSHWQGRPNFPSNTINIHTRSERTNCRAKKRKLSSDNQGKKIEAKISRNEKNQHENYRRVAMVKREYWVSRRTLFAQAVQFRVVRFSFFFLRVCVCVPRGFSCGVVPLFLDAGHHTQRSHICINASSRMRNCSVRKCTAISCVFLVLWMGKQVGEGWGMRD